MKTLINRNVKSHAMAFLMALLLMFGMAGQMLPGFVTVAHASDIFDIIKDDGTIDDSNSIISGSNTDSSITTVISKYKTIAAAFLGLAAITMLIFLIIQITKFGGTGDNDMARKKAIGGILTTGIAVALLGGSSVVIGFFWGALTGA